MLEIEHFFSPAYWAWAWLGSEFLISSIHVDFSFYYESDEYTKSICGLAYLYFAYS